MHKCEYCGDVNCTKRACIDAILANAAYYDEQARIGYYHDPQEKLDD